MLLSRHQNAKQNHNTEIANNFFENVAQFKYLGMTITHQHFIQKKIKGKLNSGNDCYHSVVNLSSFRFLAKNVEIGIYRV
jgi:hypothetical protein